MSCCGGAEAPPFPLRGEKSRLARKAIIDRLPQQVDQGKRSVLPSGESDSCGSMSSQIPNRSSDSRASRAASGGDPRSLEIDLQGSREREWKRLVVLLTHPVCTSGESSSPNTDDDEHPKVGRQGVRRAPTSLFRSARRKANQQHHKPEVLRKPPPGGLSDGTLS